MPNAEFGSRHARVVAAGIEATWAALLDLRWSDQRAARWLLRARGFGLARELGRTWIETFTREGALEAEAPRSVTVAMVGRPWSPVPSAVRVRTLGEVRDFTRPGWLKYGLEFALTPLGDGRTLVETRTLCEPTDERARRRFTPYWAVVRLGSGGIRHAMLAALARTAG